MSAANESDAEVRALIQSWIDAVRRHDLDGVVANHSDDVVFFDVPQPPLSKGIDAYRSAWPGFFEFLASRGVFEFEELEISASDDVAFAFGLIRCHGREGDAFPVRLSMGLRKDAGRWRIVHEHHSVPVG